MIVFRNLGKKEVNSNGTIIFDSRTIKRLKASGELLRKEEVYQAIFYPDEMLVGNFYQKHVLKKSTDTEFTILVNEQGKEPTLKECEELIRLALLEKKWIQKTSLFFKTYYEVIIPKLENKPFFISIYNPTTKRAGQILEGLFRIDRDPKKIRLKDLPLKEKSECEIFKKKSFLHPEILFIEHLIVVLG